MKWAIYIYLSLYGCIELGRPQKNKFLFLMAGPLMPYPLMAAFTFFCGFPWGSGSRKKIYSLNGRAIKRGKGGSGRSLRKKELLKKKFLYFFGYLKIKDILLKTTYQNINTANVGKVVVF